MVHYYLNKARKAITREVSTQANPQDVVSRHASMTEMEYQMVNRMLKACTHESEEQEALAIFYRHLED